VSGNATTFGFTCNKTTFLPGESIEEFYAEVGRWARRLQAEGPVEMSQVERAVYQKLKQSRIGSATGAAGTRVMERIEQAHDDRSALEVLTLVPELPRDPGRVLLQLRASSRGCAALVERFCLLRESLRIRSSFEVSERAEYLNLCGWRPSELFARESVYDFDRTYLAALGGPGSFTAAEAAAALAADRPPEMSEEEFERRLEPMVANLPTMAEGHAKLVRLVEQSIAELTERVELVGLREQRDCALAAEEAKVAVTVEGDRRERYDAMADRQHHASLRQIRALQDDRRKYGAGDDDDEADQGDDQEDVETAPESPESGDPGPAPEVAKEPAHNKATLSEVDTGADEARSPWDVSAPEAPPPSAPRDGAAPALNGVAARNVDPPPERTCCDDSAGLTAAEAEAIRAAYGAQVERVVARIDLEPPNIHRSRPPAGAAMAPG
jgi:hypothetical protein